MNILKIPSTMTEQYNGAGHALAAVVGGQIVALVYLRDVLDEYDDEAGQGELNRAVRDPRLGPTVRLLQSYGDVSVGMCSCWEFIEL